MRLGENRPENERTIGLMIYGALRKQGILTQTINGNVLVLNTDKIYPAKQLELALLE